MEMGMEMDRKERRTAREHPAIAVPRRAAAGGKTPPRPAPLLDVYEVEWITRELERLIAAASDRRWERKSPAAAPPPARRGGGGGGGGLLWRRAVAICGSRGDMVDAAALVARRRSKAPELV
uniref:Uncharacterized protein n=1 Tax=Ananas comosus var. bracteatus TaxID=296719 RepID=A0A6V7P7T9_ANACO|nr:unnamed protein product [Ananas comosus var. bracteatus]